MGEKKRKEEDGRGWKGKVRRQNLLVLIVGETSTNEGQS